jgi:hypothetical protein
MKHVWKEDEELEITKELKTFLLPRDLLSFGKKENVTKCPC